MKDRPYELKGPGRRRGGGGGEKTKQQRKNPPSSILHQILQRINSFLPKSTKRILKTSEETIYEDYKTA